LAAISSPGVLVPNARVDGDQLAAATGQVHTRLRAIQLQRLRVDPGRHRHQAAVRIARRVQAGLKGGEGRALAAIAALGRCEIHVDRALIDLQVPPDARAAGGGHAVTVVVEIAGIAARIVGRSAILDRVRVLGRGLLALALVAGAEEERREDGYELVARGCGHVDSHRACRT